MSGPVWKYDPDTHYVTEETSIPPDSTRWTTIIASGVSPEHGVRIAMAPEMEAVLRDLVAALVNTGGDYEIPDLGVRSARIVAAIDAAKGTETQGTEVRP